jgi:TRAP-type mannitol/chloroaromatic compound transport system substrate-binding protein
MKVIRKILVALLAVFLVSSSASAEFRWRAVTHAMPGTVQQQIVDDFAETVRVLSNGELTIETFAAGVLFSVFDTLDHLSNGVVEVSMVYSAYWPGRHPGFLLTTRPGCPLSTFAEGAYLDERLHPFFANLYAQFGITHLGHFMVSPIYEQLMSTVPILSIEDLQGVRIRTSGFGARFYDALGATAVSLPAPEIYTALQTGTIDAAEWTFWDENMRMNFHEVVTYVVDPAFQNGTNTYFPLTINTAAWESLPEHLQNIVLVARDQARFRSAMVLVYELKSREVWRALPNINIVRWSPEDEAHARAVGQRLFREEAERTEEGRWYLDIYRTVLWELGYREEAINLGFEP